MASFVVKDRSETFVYGIVCGNRSFADLKRLVVDGNVVCCRSVPQRVAVVGVRAVAVGGGAVAVGAAGAGGGAAGLPRRTQGERQYSQRR